MKTKLLKKLRRRGRNQIFIYSITKTNGTVTGMGYSYDDDEYSGLFNYGDTEKDVYRKAEKIYIENYLGRERLRKV